ncbi:hypothetical protein Hanom_Chr13g01186671 [Helianthus anomalus]
MQSSHIFHVVWDRNRFRASTSIRTRRVTARNGFWIGTGSVQIELRAETGFGTTQVLDRNGVSSGQVSGRHGFLHWTSFGSRWVLGRHEFPHDTSFGTRAVSTRTHFNP